MAAGGGKQQWFGNKKNVLLVARRRDQILGCGSQSHKNQGDGDGTEENSCLHGRAGKYYRLGYNKGGEGQINDCSSFEREIEND